MFFFLFFLTVEYLFYFDLILIFLLLFIFFCGKCVNFYSPRNYFQHIFPKLIHVLAVSEDLATMALSCSFKYLSGHRFNQLNTYLVTPYCHFHLVGN